MIKRLRLDGQWTSLKWDLVKASPEVWFKLFRSRRSRCKLSDSGRPIRPLEVKQKSKNPSFVFTCGAQDLWQSWWPHSPPPPQWSYCLKKANQLKLPSSFCAHFYASGTASPVYLSVCNVLAPKGLCTLYLACGAFFLPVRLTKGGHGC